MTPPEKVRGRYAPSPTGDIHLGNARTALVAWLSVRSQGGTFVWRVEDLDRPRVIRGIEERQLHDLAWLGLDWDAGPRAIPTETPLQLGPSHQSQRDHLYESALRHLNSHDLVFPCSLSRRDLRKIAGAPLATGSHPYPAGLRNDEVEGDWLDTLLSARTPEASVRLKVSSQVTTFFDQIFGSVAESVAETTGDFILRRRDALWAYQLAVVVDDAQQGITEVVRGADLLTSTARQIVLQEALGVLTPHYLHVPLLVNEQGKKLSKRNDGLTLRTLQAAGWTAEDVVGYLACTLGLQETARRTSAKNLVEVFDAEKISCNEVVIVENLLINGPRN